MALLPKAALGGDFSDVDFGIKIRGEWQAVIPGIGIDDVNGMNLIKKVLLSVGTKNVGDPRVKTRPKQST